LAEKVPRNWRKSRRHWCKLELAIQPSETNKKGASIALAPWNLNYLLVSRWML